MSGQRPIEGREAKRIRVTVELSMRDGDTHILEGRGVVLSFQHTHLPLVLLLHASTPRVYRFLAVGM